MDNLLILIGIFGFIVILTLGSSIISEGFMLFALGVILIGGIAWKLKNNADKEKEVRARKAIQFQIDEEKRQKREKEEAEQAILRSKLVKWSKTPPSIARTVNHPAGISQSSTDLKEMMEASKNGNIAALNRLVVRATDQYKQNDIEIGQCLCDILFNRQTTILEKETILKILDDFIYQITEEEYNGDGVTWGYMSYKHTPCTLLNFMIEYRQADIQAI